MSFTFGGFGNIPGNGSLEPVLDPVLHPVSQAEEASGSTTDAEQEFNNLLQIPNFNVSVI